MLEADLDPVGQKLVDLCGSGSGSGSEILLLRYLYKLKVIIMKTKKTFLKTSCIDNTEYLPNYKIDFSLSK